MASKLSVFRLFSRAGELSALKPGSVVEEDVCLPAAGIDRRQVSKYSLYRYDQLQKSLPVRPGKPLDLLQSDSILQGENSCLGPHKCLHAGTASQPFSYIVTKSPDIGSL